MTDTVRVIVEAYCYECDRVWSSMTCHRPHRVGRDHAKKTGHKVTVHTYVNEVYNEEDHEKTETTTNHPTSANKDRE